MPVSYGRFLSILTSLLAFVHGARKDEPTSVVQLRNEADDGFVNHVRRHNKTNTHPAPFKTSHVRVAKSNRMDHSPIFGDAINWMGAWRELEWTVIHFVGLVLSVLCMRHYAIGRTPLAFIFIVCANIAFVDPNVTKIDWILDMGVTVSVLTFFWYKFRKHHLKKLQRCRVHGQQQNRFVGVLANKLDGMHFFKQILGITGTGCESHSDSSSIDERLQHTASVELAVKTQSQVRSLGSSIDGSPVSDCNHCSDRDGTAWISPSPLRSGQRHRQDQNTSSSLPRAPKGDDRQLVNDAQSDLISRKANRASNHRPAADRKSTPDDIRRYRQVIETCIRSRQLSQAEECIGTMQELNLHCASSCLMLSDAYLQVFTCIYVTVIHGLMKKIPQQIHFVRFQVKDFEKALQWLDAAKKVDGQVNLQPYNTLLDACAKSGALE